jgi:hypothetical protein
MATGLGVRNVAPASVSGKPSPAPPYSPNEFERAFASCDTLDVLGRPRFWPLVREGFHPISPERVIVITDRGGDGCSSRDRRYEDTLRASLNEPLDRARLCGMTTSGIHLRAGKLELIFRLMRVMTDYYQVPHLFPNWTAGLAKREELGSTGMGRGFGLLHQFQNEGMVQLTNAPVDWWLVLFPDGADWGSLDDESVFGMIGHIFPPHHRELPGLKMRSWELTYRAAHHIVTDADRGGWARIARTDRITAAQVVNRATLLELHRDCRPRQ